MKNLLIKLAVNILKKYNTECTLEEDPNPVLIFCGRPFKAVSYHIQHPTSAEEKAKLHISAIEE